MRIAKLGDVCEFKPSKRLALIGLSQNTPVSFVPMNVLGIRQKYLTARDERPLSEVAGSYTYFAEGDVLLAKITPCFENGKLGIAKGLTNGVGFGSSEFTVIRPSPGILAEYVYYYLNRDEVRESGAKVMTGAVGHKRVPQDFVETLEIPLPPLEEQRRIVAVLDEAFAAIATATTNAEKNLANARELLRGAIDQRFAKDDWPSRPLGVLTSVFDDGDWVESKDQSPEGIRLIQTGNVGDGYFKDRAEKARYVSDATFKRLRCTEIFAGDCLVSRLPDPVGRACIIPETDERMITAVDCTIVRFDADTLPAGLFCYYAQSSEYAAQIAKLTTGATRLRISRSNLGTIKIPVPPLPDQDGLLSELDELAAEVEALEDAQRKKLEALEGLKQSLLHYAFAGKLPLKSPTTPIPSNDNFATPEFTANVIAYGYWLHKRHNRDKSYKRIKAQKCLHNVETIARVDLGRVPRQYRNGPHDEQHMACAQNWAKSVGFFEFVLSNDGISYDFKKLANHDEFWNAATNAIRPVSTELERAISPLVPMDMTEAEVFTTVYAAWNNLIRDGVSITDDAIVKAARDDWDPPKNIPAQKFRDAIKLLQVKGMVPDGSAKYVGGQARLL